jgi:hypothetical protein
MSGRKGFMLLDALLGVFLMLMLVRLIWNMTVLDALQAFSPGCWEMEELWETRPELQIERPEDPPPQNGGQLPPPSP